MKLGTGEFNTKDLIDCFGTSKLKSRFERDKKITGRDKELLLAKASKFCNIEDLGKGKFCIYKVYGLVKDDYILPLKKGMYKYFTPLILSKLLYEQDENYKVTLPFLGWARKFEIVNDNYSFIKYHQEESSKYLSINEDIMYEYFSRIDDCIKHYLLECLDKLAEKSKLNLLEYDYITMGRKIHRETKENESGILEIVCSHVDEILTDEERKFVIDCENKAKVFANIEQEKEKYYGTKSFIFKNEMKKLLLEKDILFTYTAFNIFCKNKEGVRDVLEKFKYDDNCTEENFIKDFDEKFIEYINKKAQLRKDKEVQKSLDDNINKKIIQEHRLLSTYLEEISNLSDITISKDAKILKNKIDIIDTVENLVSEFNINIRKGKSKKN